MAKILGKKNKLDNSFRINDELKGNYKVRIVGEDIESKVVSLDEAKEIAEAQELDLIEINSKSEIPILRIADYSKFLYNLKKAAKKNKQQAKPLKEVQLRANIASNDLRTKETHARKFIEEGMKVKVVLTMRGRELSRREDNKKVIYEFITALTDVATPEAMPKDEGNKTTVILKKKNNGSKS